MKQLRHLAPLVILGLTVACNGSVQQAPQRDGTGAAPGIDNPTAGGQGSGGGSTASGGPGGDSTSGGTSGGDSTASGGPGGDSTASGGRGGDSTSGSTSGGGSTASGAPTGACEGLAGRYVVTLDGLVAHLQAHLALEEDGDDCRATLSHPWDYRHPRASLDSRPVTMTPGEITLGPFLFSLYPDPRVHPTTGFNGIELSELRLPRHLHGPLAGTATGRGFLPTHEGPRCDDLCNNDLCPPIQGTVSPDPDPIELRLQVKEPEAHAVFGGVCADLIDFGTAPQGRALPWDRLVVNSAWPAHGLIAALGTPHLEGTGAAVAFGGWQPPDAMGWAPWTWLKDWDAVGGKTVVVPLQAAHLPAGVAPSRLELSFLAAPPAGAGPYEFDVLPASVLAFGDVSIENGRVILDGGEAIAGRIVTEDSLQIFIDIANAEDGVDLSHVLAGIRVVGRSSGPRPFFGGRRYGGGLLSAELVGDDEAAFTIASAPESQGRIEIERIWVE